MNRKNLKRRPNRDGGTWYVVYNVPKTLQRKYGLPREIVRTLRTTDHGEAVHLKSEKLLQIQSEIHKITLGHSEWTDERMTVEALRYAKLRRDAGEASGSPYYIPGLDELIDEQIDAFDYGGEEPRRIRRFADIAYGKAIPISVAAAEWRAGWEGIAERTRQKYEKVLREFQRHFDDCAIHEITRRHGVEYYRHLSAIPSARTGEPRAEATVRGEIINLSSFFKACVHNGLLPLNHENPFEKVTSRVPGKKKKEGEKRDLRAVTREEAQRLLVACDNEQRTERPLKYSYEMMALVRLLWVTGTRANEIASLTPDRIEDQGDLIWLSIIEAKTNASNRLLCLVGEPERQLIRKALTWREEILVESDREGKGRIPDENRELLFPRLRRGGADNQPYWYLGKAFQGVRKAVFGNNLNWHMHSFRRRAVTALAEAGVPEQDRNLVIGHSNSRDFGLHVYADAERRKTVERTMQKLYEELGGSL